MTQPPTSCRVGPKSAKKGGERDPNQSTRLGSSRDRSRKLRSRSGRGPRRRCHRTGGAAASHPRGSRRGRAIGANGGVARAARQGHSEHTSVELREGGTVPVRLPRRTDVWSPAGVSRSPRGDTGIHRTRRAPRWRRRPSGGAAVRRAGGRNRLSTGGRSRRIPGTPLRLLLILSLLEGEPFRHINGDTSRVIRVT
jgi:hypothetical protein